MRAEPGLALKLSIGRDWKRTTTEDTVLLIPAGEEDFAIMVMRTTAALADVAAVERFGELGDLKLERPAISPQGRVVSRCRGSAVFRSTNQRVAIYLARVRDPARSTIVAALVAMPSMQRGEAAFEHVLQTLEFAVPAAAPQAGTPAWLQRSAARDTEDDEVTEPAAEESSDPPADPQDPEEDHD